MKVLTQRLRFGTLLLFPLILASYSCSADTDILAEPETEDAVEEAQDPATETELSSCANPLEYVFNEKDGLILVEFEDAEFTEDWKLKTDGNNHSGDGYMVWEGPQHLGDPGNGTATFKIKVKNPGTYQFIWHSSVKIGTSGTDHNDSWLRFDDADDFYGQNGQGTSTVYPKDRGKAPNPAGATKDGWFKIYRGGNDLDFKWQSLTFDSNGHTIFVVFEDPGTYLMEVSARSSGHGIDKFLLFNESMTKEDAIASTERSVISCD